VRPFAPHEIEAPIDRFSGRARVVDRDDLRFARGLGTAGGRRDVPVFDELETFGFA
jgi:hypothetical protein